MVDAFGCEGGYVFCEVSVGEVSEGDADAVVEGEVGLREQGGPRAGADVGEDSEGVGVGGRDGGGYRGDC